MGEVVALWIESRTRNPKVASSNLGPAGIVGGVLEQDTDCARVCVCVCGRACSLLCVCALDRLNAEHKL